MNETEKRALEFMKTTPPCVIATCAGEGKTEAAMIYAYPNDEFTFFISTNANSRKIENIRSNPRVSLVFGNPEKMMTVQLDGNMRILEGEDARKAKEFIITADVTQRLHVAKEPLALLEFKPFWMRFSAFLDVPETIYEKTFNVY
ncbi:MAG: pyridoxamine 5'-phosphate oxidase family protein [Parcubacteria group bacterium]